MGLMACIILSVMLTKSMTIKEYEAIAQRVMATGVPEYMGMESLNLVGDGICNCFGACLTRRPNGELWLVKHKGGGGGGN